MRGRTSVANSVVEFIRKRYGRAVARGWYRDPFKVLVGCVLSQRTREENTDLACRSLFSVASTPGEILRLRLTELQRLIKPAGLTKQKAANIRRLSKILIEEYGGEVPADRESLMKLPGVGPKTADVTLCYGFNHPCIPVDVHVNRISRRIGLIDEGVRLEEVGKLLQGIFQKKDWHLINRGLVLFGREVCLPRRPKCPACSLNHLCNHGQQTLKRRVKRSLVTD
jgi:endonuclease-3